jgi:hypothetical protein
VGLPRGLGVLRFSDTRSACSEKQKALTSKASCLG